MKVTHLNNSFIIIEGGGVKLVCDPWTGISNYGTWHALPIFVDDDIRKITQDADFVYISHLHADHLDPDTLKLCRLENARFVINRNNQPVLRRRLEMIGAKEIIECDPFTIVDLGGLKIATVPQMSQNTAGLECEVDYDLDSSIIASDGSAVFFNQVDNPISVDDARHIGDWARDNMGEIALGAMTCGAASEYPQCFMNIDRNSEKARVEQASIDMLLRRLEVLKPRNIFLGGGTYFIPGRNAPLNKYIAVPPASKVTAAVSEAFPDIGFFDLEGGGTITIGVSDELPELLQAINPVHRNLSTAIQATADLAYGQDDIIIDNIDDEISRVLPLATDALAKQLASDGIQMKARLKFALHSQLKLDDEGVIISEPLEVFDLVLPVENPDHMLVLHLDKVMFAELIRGKMIWNLVLSGSQIMYERTPNVFHPTDTAALNFFVHREKR